MSRDHYSRDRNNSSTRSHTSHSHSRHGDDRRDGNRRSFGNLRNRGDDRREGDRRAFDDNRKFNRNDRTDDRRTFGSGGNVQGRRGNNSSGSYGNNRGNGGGDRRGFDRRGSRQTGNSFDRRRSDGNRDSGRRFDRNSSRGSIGNRRNPPQSPRRRTDTERMPPPSRRGGVRGNRPVGGNDRSINRRRLPPSITHRSSDDKTAQTRRRLAEKHVGRNTGRDILAKKIRMAKMRSTLTTRKRTTMPVRRVKSAVKKPEKKDSKKKEDSKRDSDKEKEIKKEDEKADKKTATDEEGGSAAEDEDIEDDKEKSPKSKKDSKKKSTSTPIKVNINLECIQCKSKCLTVKEYVVHLHGRAHDRAMQRIALRQRAQISRLRLQQRNAQKEIDEKLGDIRSNYCGTCMLRHRQSRTEHATSEDHRSIQKFLRPYCSICKIGFHRPMVFEQHRCSIEHLRRKALIEKTGKTTEECEVDLDDFTTVDEVGEEDDEPTEPEKPEPELIDAAISEDEVEIANEEEINVGAEHIKLVQAHYCNLCYSYISHKGDVEVNLKRHCARSQHLRFYVQCKDDLVLKEEAEALHKKREAEKKKREKEAAEKKAKEDAEKAEKDAVETTENGTAEEADTETNKKEGIEIKEELNGTKLNKTDETEIWETLNQDIGELIGEDEDNNEDDRFDRLNSEKKDNGIKENGSIDIKVEVVQMTEKDEK